MILTTTQQAIQAWHQMLCSRDMTVLDELLDEQVIFRSPVAFNPYEGKTVVRLY